MFDILKPFANQFWVHLAIFIVIDRVQARLDRGCGTGKAAEGPGVEADSRDPFLFPIPEPVDKL